MAIEQDVRQASVKARGVLAQEIAGWSSDPNFYGALAYLPNPDTVLRRLGRAHEAYDAITGDAHVIGELRAVRAGLLSYEWRLQAGGESRADKRALELCEQVFAALPGPGQRWPDVIWQMAQAVFRGYQVHEVVWGRQGDVLVPECLLDRPSRRFVFEPGGAPRVLTRQAPTLGEEMGPYKWLLPRHMPSYDNPYGVAVFSACFWPYTFKHSGWRFFVKFAEKYGLPWAVGKYPPGTPPAQQQELAQRLSEMIEDAVAAIPADGSVDLISVGTGMAALPQERLIRACNTELSKAITSQTLATEIQGQGSRAAAETHLDRERGVHSSDRGVIEDALSQLCAWICELNVPGAVPPRFEFYDEAQARQDWVEVLDKARQYVDVPVSFAHDRLQIPQPVGGEPVLPRSAAPAPRPGAGLAFARGEEPPADALADRLEIEAQAAMAGWLDTIRDLAAQAPTLEALRDRLLDAYGDLPTERLGAVMRLAFSAADLAGRYDVAREAGLLED